MNVPSVRKSHQPIVRSVVAAINQAFRPALILPTSAVPLLKSVKTCEALR